MNIHPPINALVTAVPQGKRLTSFSKNLKHAQYVIYFLLSQRIPEYPRGHVQKYLADPLKTHVPLFRHGEDEQLSTEIKIETLVHL